MSASAPAGSAKRKSGKVVATWTIETMKGSGLRSVINQPDAALYIQPPILEMTVAPPHDRKARVTKRAPGGACAAVRGRRGGCVAAQVSSEVSSTEGKPFWINGAT